MRMNFDPAEATRKLAALGYQVTPPSPPLPVAHCALCGLTEEENRKWYGSGLVPVELIVNSGEEGFSDVKRFYCDEHIDDVRNAVLMLGLGSHRHGSTTFIEADPTICGGYGKCKFFDPEHTEEIYYNGPDRGET
jgi:hypothetical protein